MVYQLIQVIWTALSACFQFADDIFLGVGIPLVTAITIMVLVSSILRLFSARFVGQQINLGRARKEKADSKGNKDTEEK